MMKIEEELEKLKAELEKEEPVEQEEENLEVETPVEEPEEEPKEEPKEEEKPEIKAEEKPEDDGAWARMRREKAAEKKRADELEARLRELESKVSAPREETQPDQPSVQIVPPILESIIEREQYIQAGNEFSKIEAEFSRTVPDYEEVSNAYKVEVYRTVRLDNPRLSHEEILERTNKKLLLKASEYVNQGYNPIEEMYHDAKALNLSIPKAQEVPAKEERVLKPDLDKIAANRARNAGTAAAKGAGDRGELTLSYAANLTAAEYAKLSPAERRRVMEMANEAALAG